MAVCPISFSADSINMVLLNMGTLHLSDSGEFDIDGPGPQRAVLMSRMPEFAPAALALLSRDRFGIVAFRAGGLDLFKVDSDSLAIIPDGPIAIVDVKRDRGNGKPRANSRGSDEMIGEGPGRTGERRPSFTVARR